MGAFMRGSPSAPGDTDTQQPDQSDHTRRCVSGASRLSFDSETFALGPLNLTLAAPTTFEAKAFGDYSSPIEVVVNSYIMPYNDLKLDSLEVNVRQ
eukprot:8630928-Pyramimonas_sp.AAC.1